MENYLKKKKLQRENIEETNIIIYLKEDKQRLKEYHEARRSDLLYFFTLYKNEKIIDLR